MEPRASLSCALACLGLDRSLRYGVLYGVLYEIEGEPGIIVFLYRYARYAAQLERTNYV